MLSPPLRDRFGVTLRLEFYKVDELRTILMRSARILGIRIEDAGACEIARRSRGTPRIANRLLRRVRDFAEVKADGVITLEVADGGLKMLDVDEKGFDRMDRKILSTIIEKYDGGPVGIETLAAAVSEERDTLEDVYEPYLIQEGYLNKTPARQARHPPGLRTHGLRLPRRRAVAPLLNPVPPGSHALLPVKSPPATGKNWRGIPGNTVGAASSREFFPTPAIHHRGRSAFTSESRSQ